MTTDGGLRWARYQLANGQERVDIKKLVDAEQHQTHQMCCCCFEYIPVDELWVDEDGTKWDVCPDCKDKVRPL